MGAETSGARVGMRLGLRRLGRDLLHRRQRFRQFLGIALLAALTLLGEPHPLPFWAGAGLVAAGASLRLWASGCLRKNEELATHGPYALVRHPLYLGNVAICLGFALAAGRAWGAWAAALLLLLCYPPAIDHEDRKLARLFPHALVAWAETTLALLPSRPATSARLRTHWSLRRSLFANGEPLYALLLAGCLLLLHARLGSVHVDAPSPPPPYEGTP